MTTQLPGSFKALIPFIIFLFIFIGSGLWYTVHGIEYAFYQLPPPVAILPAIIAAILLSNNTTTRTIDEFIKGMGDSNILAMCAIYLLAGGFAAVAKATGGVDATVNAGLSVIPSWFMLPGIFIIASFISTAMGTSMGTIGALAPIAIGLAESTHISSLLMAGTVLSGAMFGDNLSIISDTTIAATRTQGCEMRDKFKENIKLALPAAIIVTVLYFLLNNVTVSPDHNSTDLLKVIPYLLILILAVSGFNVFVVLGFGIIIAGTIGLITLPDYSLHKFTHDIYDGFSSMQEIFLLSLFVGGLSHLMANQGGLKFISEKINKIIALFSKTHTNEANETAAELGIAGAVSITNICTANNTVAIIVTGSVAKELANKNGVTPKRSASILDIYSCVVQGIIPWGAQILLLGAIFKQDPLDISLYAYYPMILAVTTTLQLFFKK